MRLEGLVHSSIGCVALLAAGMVAAEAPSSSIRPTTRGGETFVATLPARVAAAPATVGLVQVTAAGVPVHIGAEIRPRPRGGVSRPNEVAADSAVQVARQVMPVHFDAKIRPNPRPEHPLADYSVTPVSAKSNPVTEPKARPAGFGKIFRKKDGGYSKKGSVCGVNAIKGTPKQSFGKPGSGCGIADPVQVTEVSGVRLSQAAKIDCATAKALNSWVQDGIKPAFGKQGGGVKELKIAAHYTCRNRNNKAGGKLSEHAKGHAVDVSGIRLKDGTEVSVLKGWRSRKWSKEMRNVHRSACGPFGTVLGPKADRYHQDHFHVDTARYRSGSYCR